MSAFSHKPTIVGTAIVLRPVRVIDEDHLWADLHDADAIRFTGTHATFTHEQIIDWCATRGSQDDRLDLAVTDIVTGQWLGEVVINDWEPDNRACGFRIALSASARNRGLGTEATRLLVDYVFDEIDEPAPIHRLALEVYHFNERAIAVYEKVGFVREGVRRGALFWDGEFHDAISMSILRSDRIPTGHRTD